MTTRFMMTPDRFAQHLGYNTYEELMQHSEPAVYPNKDITWYVTRLPNGLWAAWDDSELSPDRVAYLPNRDAAITYHLEAYLRLE